MLRIAYYGSQRDKSEGDKGGSCQRWCGRRTCINLSFTPIGPKPPAKARNRSLTWLFVDSDSGPSIACCLFPSSLCAVHLASSPLQSYCHHQGPRTIQTRFKEDEIYTLGQGRGQTEHFWGPNDQRGLLQHLLTGVTDYGSSACLTGPCWLLVLAALSCADWLCAPFSLGLSGGYMLLPP